MQNFTTILYRVMYYALWAAMISTAYKGGQVILTWEHRPWGASVIMLLTLACFAGVFWVIKGSLLEEEEQQSCDDS